MSKINEIMELIESVRKNVGYIRNRVIKYSSDAEKRKNTRSLSKKMNGCCDKLELLVKNGQDNSYFKSEGSINKLYEIKEEFTDLSIELSDETGGFWLSDKFKDIDYAMRRIPTIFRHH